MSKINLKFSFMLEDRQHERLYKYWEGPVPAAGTTVTMPLHSINGRRYQIPESRDLIVDRVAWSVALIDYPSGHITFEPTDVQAINVTVFCTVL